MKWDASFHLIEESPVVVRDYHSLTLGQARKVKKKFSPGNAETGSLSLSPSKLCHQIQVCNWREREDMIDATERGRQHKNEEREGSRRWQSSLKAANNLSLFSIVPISSWNGRRTIWSQPQKISFLGTKLLSKNFVHNGLDFNTRVSYFFYLIKDLVMSYPGKVKKGPDSSQVGSIWVITLRKGEWDRPVCSYLAESRLCCVLVVAVVVVGVGVGAISCPDSPPLFVEASCILYDYHSKCNWIGQKAGWEMDIQSETRRNFCCNSF